ncbi:chitin synthase, class IV [Polychytrium aggregatum]|uniref:chitin synthase, class IV n=1 Tax=Polychytrium aggregatum TaxID=110093 RepID=UPI0022FEA01A|nr:chitin synthase, class IV [Polychytrium aggregatum]KAI9208189.1 chitin synthase, class IV [Polychytrium aggregatum]
MSSFYKSSQDPLRASTPAMESPVAPSASLPRRNTARQGGAMQRSNTLSRKKSLVRPERAPQNRTLHPALNSDGTIPRRSKSVVSERHSSLGRSDTIFRRSLGRKRRDGPERTPWVIASYFLTCFIPNRLLFVCGKRDVYIQQAFREKLALCVVIALLMFAVGFLTFGFQFVLCPPNAIPTYPYLGPFPSTVAISGTPTKLFTIRGSIYYINPSKTSDPFLTNVVNLDGGTDLTFAIPSSNPACAGSSNGFSDSSDARLNSCYVQKGSNKTKISCLVIQPPKNQLSDYFVYYGDTLMAWNDINQNYVVYNGAILDITHYSDVQNIYGSAMTNVIQSHTGNNAIAHDMTDTIARSNTLRSQAVCLADTFTIAKLNGLSVGCAISFVVTNISLIIIAGVVILRFILAIFFSYAIGWRLGDRGDKTTNRAAEHLARRVTERRTLARTRTATRTNIPLDSVVSRQPAGSSINSRRVNGTESVDGQSSSASDETRSHQWGWSANFGFMDNADENSDLANDPFLDESLVQSLILVTCYSEGYQSLRNTLDSVAKTYYPSTHKCLFVIADGIVTGHGEPKSTPDMLIDMMDVDPRFKGDDPKHGGEPQAFSYVAIADGNKRKNFARVYAGWYKWSRTEVLDAEKEKEREKERHKRGFRSSTLPNDTASASEASESDIMPALKTIKDRKEGRVPMILVVKCGNDEERNDPHVKKPGNRGKRDTQVLLMNFLTKVMFDDRMTELEFDIFFKLWTITGVHPERYEGLLMIDADTEIYPDSLTHLVAVMHKDPMIMGLCGETKVKNKWGSWVTMIQVFEYFVSHHLSKAFESVFGGVTCLPGCFCMYRIKAPKGDNGHYVPVLANPDVVEEYAENIVDTLHKKNLLLLGEDRFLTTMMLRAFPHRKMMFVPNAICKTVVPDEFKILLSQRRRWINSTIHNLLELVLVRDLCGIFCFSMQFVVFMELVGTVVLPAAISFTLYIVCLAIYLAVTSPGSPNMPTQPLLLLLAILGLPAVLIVLTAKRWIYVFWMLVYLLALPIWNFVLPLYAFWHFDDFSWGETRKVSGEATQEDHSKADGVFDGTGINMKRWMEWVEERRVQAEQAEQERLTAYLANSNRMVPVQVMAPGAAPPPGSVPVFIHGGPLRSNGSIHSGKSVSAARHGHSDSDFIPTVKLSGYIPTFEEQQRAGSVHSTSGTYPGAATPVPGALPYDTPFPPRPQVNAAHLVAPTRTTSSVQSGSQNSGSATPHSDI